VTSGIRGLTKDVVVAATEHLIARFEGGVEYDPHRSPGPAIADFNGDIATVIQPKVDELRSVVVKEGVSPAHIVSMAHLGQRQRAQQPERGNCIANTGHFDVLHVEAAKPGSRRRQQGGSVPSEEPAARENNLEDQEVILNSNCNSNRTATSKLRRLELKFGDFLKGPGATWLR
jgi:hypothetical protein